MSQLGRGRLGDVIERLERVEGGLRGVEGRVERMEARLRRVEGRLERVEGEVRGLRWEVDVSFFLLKFVFESLKFCLTKKMTRR